MYRVVETTTLSERFVISTSELVTVWMGSEKMIVIVAPSETPLCPWVGLVENTNGAVVSS